MFQTRIKELRESAGYKSQQELADALGTSQSTVANWESGRRFPKRTTMMQLAQFFGVSVDDLMGNDGYHSVSNGYNIGIRIPILGYIPAGIPVEAVEDILDWEEIPPEWATGGREYFGLKVKGDSMYPKYLDGDTVILRKQTTCDSGDDCAVMVNGDDSTLKQVFFREDGSMEIRPLNPSYPPRTFSVAEIETLPVSIAGVVVELRRKIK